jgi:wobble nucleotide-excising tRNase
MQCLVYNRDFRDRNFKVSSPLKGVFTLGERSVKLVADIEEKSRQIAKKVEESEGLKRNLVGDEKIPGKLSELEQLHASFADTCWMQKVKHEGTFEPAFAGVLNNKAKFRERVLIEQSSNKSTLATIEELVERAETVFAESPLKEVPLVCPDYAELEKCELNPVLSKVVVGSAEVAIAALIRKLRSGDWVSDGRKFLSESEGKCPFCQQALPEDLDVQLTSFFDQAYDDDCRSIKEVLENYEKWGGVLQARIKTIVDGGSSRLDITQLRSQGEAISAIVSENIEHLKRKRLQPSTKVELRKIGPSCLAIKSMIDGANKAIGEHNARVDNLPNEKRNLTSQVWRYVLDVELKSELSKYKAQRASLETAIDAIKAKITASETEIRSLSDELRALERQTTSIKPAMDDINKTLASFGFTTFRLAQSSTPGMYELQRMDGSPVNNTLSDGERTFLTFLYFYCLIGGSESDSGTTARRVVVFDDPISSLDSDILFVVSSLVKNVFALARDAGSSVAQVFVLTHNVYFHKEITFDSSNKSGQARAFESYWIIRRDGEESSIERCDDNPIKSSYELLWAELRRKNPSPNTICNAMRRILENYFKLLGGVDLHELYKKFEGEEKTICKSLVSWMHDGSHFAMEDLHLSPTVDAVNKYSSVFRKVFENHGHEAHYRMMMGDAYVESPATVS